MPVTYVSAIYCIPNGLRSSDFYISRFEGLLKTGIPIICYLDKQLEAKGIELCSKYSNLTIPTYVTLDTSWIPSTVQLPSNRKVEKDTKEYFAVQLQKAWCMVDAAKYIQTSHSAWIDAGILNQPGFDDNETVTKYLHKIAESSWPEEIICPGAYTHETLNTWFAENPNEHFFDWPVWQCLGSFLLGPTHGWTLLYEKQKAIVQETLPRLGWEVNYWAKLNMFRWYYSSHNISMLENVFGLMV